jgi:hypothetical protein
MNDVLRETLLAHLQEARRLIELPVEGDRSWLIAAERRFLKATDKYFVVTPVDG